MMTTWLWRAAFLGAAAAGAALPGCGSSNDSVTTASKADQRKVQSPLLSIGDSQLAVPADQNSPTPEDLLNKIKRLRMAPVENANSPAALVEAQRHRQHQIVDMASEVIAKTHGNSAKNRTFEDAAFLLMSARHQLALAGDRQQASALYADAEEFYKRDPESKAAAEAGFILVNYAHAAAMREPNSMTVQEFARLARRFAENFPAESARAGELLMIAGKSCELNGHNTAATACYRQLVEKFSSDSSFQEATACLRRLNVIGQPLDIAGPTIDGGFVSSTTAIQKGQPLLVFFWSPSQPASREWATAVQELMQRESGKFSLVGVTVGEDVQTNSQFLNETRLGGEHLCFTTEQDKGWKNPVVAYYGLQQVPTLWLVGRDGVVRATHLNPETLPAALDAALAGTAAN